MRIRSLALIAVGLSGCQAWEPSYAPTNNIEFGQNNPGKPRALELSGGTLAIAGGGRYAVVSDPDADRVWVVDLSTGVLKGKVQLSPGSQPERIVEDGDGRVRVALRGTGK